MAVSHQYAFSTLSGDVKIQILHLALLGKDEEIV
jgi:hypothetical protein